jgi:hypothetical protein
MVQMVWKFVDQPTLTPATLFDMNNWSMGCIVDMGDDGSKFDISPPPLRRIKATNNLTDGALNTVISYDNRILKFSLGIGPGTKAAKTILLNNLMSELYKPSNLIMYQPDSTRPPVFFQTIRSDDVVIRNQGSGISEVWGVDLNVEAKPFAIGARIDLSQVTVSNDPSAASGNKSFWDITGIVGDVPTPAFMQISDLGAGGKAYIGQRAFGNPTSLTLFAQAESGTLGTDATVVADAAASNGNRVNVSFATNAGWATRLTFNSLPGGTDAAALRGRYRVVARVTAAVAAINTSIRWKQATSGDFVPGPYKTVDLVGPNWSHIDLGIIEFPAPQMTPESFGYSGVQTQHITSPITIEAIRNSGTGTLLIDWVYLLPATERLCSLFQLKSLASGVLIVDGPNDATYGIASGSTPFGATRLVDNKQGVITRHGGLPMLVPGLTNRMHFLHNESANGTNETVNVSYWPRWKEVASV